MNRSILQRLLAAGALVTASVVSLPAFADPYSGLFVFGDSLSDVGNNALAGLFAPGQVVTGNTYVPTSAYGPAGTYSNGLVWASYFASMIGVPLTPSLAGGGDYAFGGATTGTPGVGPGGFPYSLLTQTGMYLGATGGHASADALYVVAGGGNDARNAVAAIAATPAQAPAIAAAAAAAYANHSGAIVDSLQAAGAQHIVVWNTPNIGVTPALTALGASGLGSFVAGTMNAALALRLAGETDVTTFDIYGFGSMLAANPAAYGFTDATDACGAVAGANCSQYEYWDGIHPTTTAHLAIAEALFAAVTPVPEPATWALMGAGLLGVVLQRRRAVRALPVAA
jgi:outer membrane lipase/esterase